MAGSDRVAPGSLAELAERLHWEGEEGLLLQSLAHRSWCAEQEGKESNERLELLGDAVLGLVVAEELYRDYPHYQEGAMAQIRAQVVSTSSLAAAAQEMGLDELVLLGKGEESSGGRAKASILADCFEAVIGACYLQGGLERARAVILRELSTSMKEAARAPGREDYKTRLQELVTQRFQDAPVYELSEWGPDHSKRFGATVIVAGEVLGYGEGPSKKEAQQRAAQQGWCRLTEGLGLPDAPRGQEATAEHEGMEEGGA